MTRIETLKGHDVLIPNHDIYTNPLKNLTRQSKQRVDVEAGVSYADDLSEVQQIAEAALHDIEELDPVEVFFAGFGGSSVDLVARFWVQSGEPTSMMKARSNAIVAIETAFDNNNITTPFPIRTVDFGIKGGVSLERSLPSFDERAKRNCSRESARETT